MHSDLARDLARVINSHSAENGSDTPDFILADFLIGCLTAFDTTVRARDIHVAHPSTPHPLAPPAPTPLASAAAQHSLRRAHDMLDLHGVPSYDPVGTPLTLEERIHLGVST